MNIQTIAEHSVATDLLTGGICIDVGCRGFQFSTAMRDFGCTVEAFDLEDMQAPEGINFHKAAVYTKNWVMHYVDTNDKQAKYLSDKGIEIASIKLNDLYDLFGDIDILKLDCEGTEYHLLSDKAFKPIPRQISVEFHEHCHKHLHDEYFNLCMENLLKYYEPVQHERYAAHGAGMNYWDSLFVRRDLL